MKLTGLILFFCLFSFSLSAQYYFTGEVKDPHGDKLQNGNIVVQSTGTAYRTGLYGEFGIISRKPEDTLILSFEGYEPYTIPVTAATFLKITLKRLSYPAYSKAKYLKCAFSNIPRYDGQSAQGGRAVNGLVENPFVDQSASTSIRGNTDRASYGMIRRFLDMGYPVPPDAVQIEEMLDYFNSYYEDPEKEDLFHCSSDLLPCPWNTAHKLLCLNICARKADIQNAPPANLVFLMDVSGSMDLPNKLPMIKSGIHLLVKNLRVTDTISVIVFGENVRALLVGIPGSEKERIMKTIDELTPNGSTPGEEGLRMAYQVARRQFIPGGTNRIVLITDGDMNEGLSTEKELEDFIEQQSQDGIRLSCMGVGMSNISDPELLSLARKGHGDFANAADEQDAEKLLASQLSPTLFSVADGVSITADFNPALVREYRLIGYDNRKNVLDDTTFALEGNKMGSGHSLLALFELNPKKDTIGLDTLATVRINYCLPGQKSLKAMSYICPNKSIPFDRAAKCLKKATCIAMFGMKLRESGYVTQVSWSDIDKMAKMNFGGNDCLDKEYMALVAKARIVYKHNRAAVVAE